MGLFQQRPEEQLNEWAGLPSEPIEPDSTATLDAAPPADMFGLGTGFTTISLAEVSVPMPVPTEDVTDEPDTTD